MGRHKAAAQRRDAEMRVGLIGLGHVGALMRGLFSGHAELIEYDVATHSAYPKSELSECDFAVVSVGTPAREDGSCDTSHVRDAVSQLPIKRVLLRSTVPPGTTAELVRETGKQICFMPEYVGETHFSQLWSGEDTHIPFLIFGGDPPIREYFVDQLLPIVGPDKFIHQCSSSEAELIKYMENAYFATKVAFVNEFYEISRLLKLDWHAVREGWLLDPRVERDHSAVFPSARGFSGRCLPKDLSAIVQVAREAGWQPTLLAAVGESNRQVQEASRLDPTGGHRT
jgi:nucleotide sugar dehydrogenase